LFSSPQDPSPSSPSDIEKTNEDEED
jgi:hypothetical protein